MTGSRTTEQDDAVNGRAAWVVLAVVGVAVVAAAGIGAAATTPERPLDAAEPTANDRSGLDDRGVDQAPSEAENETTTLNGEERRLQARLIVGAALLGGAMLVLSFRRF